MADTVVAPHDKMRSRDVQRVTRGQQAPLPARELGTVSDALPPPETDVLMIGTAPNDFRFPCTNQTRHCYARYLEYHQYLSLSARESRGSLGCCSGVGRQKEKSRRRARSSSDTTDLSDQLNGLYHGTSRDSWEHFRVLFDMVTNVTVELQSGCQDSESNSL